MPCPESLHTGKRAGESMKRARGRVKGGRGAAGRKGPFVGEGDAAATVKAGPLLPCSLRPIRGLKRFSVRARFF
jgi:hypothetical protein